MKDDNLLDDLLIDGPRGSRKTIVLAHGAGAAMDSPFMNTVAQGLAQKKIRVVRFEFPYMKARRTAGKRGAPDREPVLIEAWREVITRLGGGERLVIGGKSMGGRIASMVADEVEGAGTGMSRLSVPSAGPGGAPFARETPGDADDVRSHSPGDSRYLRPARGSRTLQALPKIKDRMDRRRRPFPQAEG